MIDYSKNMATEISDADLIEIEEAVEEIIDEAHLRYEDVVTLLMLKKPYRYLRF